MSDSSLTIRSGGQTGADRAALDWAFKNGVLAGKKDIRLMALTDHDLEPLWREIGKT
jgi:hypothetical protein